VMEELVAASNMRRALKRVRANKGSPGIDGMTVDELPSYLMDAWPRIKQSLLDGSYRPQPVKRVEIAKRGGGMRELGIPTVLDRLIQQALLQVLGPMCEPTFSDHSYGFRPGRNAYQAVESARRFVASVTDFLERKLRLRVNRGKSVVARPWHRKLLGYRIIAQREMGLTVAPDRLRDAKVRIRRLTRRNRGVSLQQVLKELRTFTDGWVTYSRHASGARVFGDLDQWTRRRLRCYVWKQWKKPRKRARELLKAGVGHYAAWGMAYDGPGLWRAAGSPPMHKALSNQTLNELGYHSLLDRYLALKAA